MSLWEFGCCVQGWKRANVSDDKPAFPTPEQHAANVARVTLH